MEDNTHASASPTDREKNIFKRVLNWLLETKEDATNNPTEHQEEQTEDKTILAYTDALAKSIQSIHDDDTLNDREKVEMLQKSFDQFNEAVEKVHMPEEPETDNPLHHEESEDEQGDDP